MPSLFPMATNAGINPPFAAACAAALCWFAPEICMMILRRSRGAVHVLANAPAVPPARNKARPVPMTCVTTAIGRRSINRAMVSLGASSAVVFDAAASSPITGFCPCTSLVVMDANLLEPRKAVDGVSVGAVAVTRVLANPRASTRLGTAIRRPRLGGAMLDVSLLPNGIAKAYGHSVEHSPRGESRGSGPVRV